MVSVQSDSTILSFAAEDVQSGSVVWIGQTRPPAMTPLIGRTGELQTLTEQLASPAARLLTLTGPGGVGKTRLAVALLESLQGTFDGQVGFVSLAAVTDYAHVPGEIARAVGGETGGSRTPLEAISRATGIRRTLLVLDNLEQIIDAAPFIVELLAELPALQLVVTSRESLRVRGEQVYPLTPLPFDGSDELSDAVRLFISRAQSIDPRFETSDTQLTAIKAICTRLDGLPLAIELAAARSRALSPSALLARLDDRLRLLDRGPRDLPARQRTLRDAVAWSYELLQPEEQAVFQVIAVFQGGAPIEALDSIWPDWDARHANDELLDLLDSLVAKSLAVSVGDSGGPRVTLLETLRAFGLDELEASGRLDVARTLHADWCLSLATSASAGLTGPDRAALLTRLDQELPNVRAALAWSIAAGDAGRALRFVDGIWRYWETRGLLAEGFELTRQALELPAFGLDPALRANALYGAAVLPYRLGRFDEARVHAEECLALQRARNDVDGTARGLTACGLIAFDQGDFDRSEAFQLEGLALVRSLGQPHRLSICHINLGILYLEQNRLDDAWAAYSSAFELNAGPGLEIDRAYALNGLGLVSHRRDDLATAVEQFEAAISIRRAEGDTGTLAASLTNLGAVKLDGGEHAAGLLLLKEALELRWKRGELRGTAEALAGIARVAAATGQLDTAGRLLGAVEQLAERGQRLPRGVEQATDNLRATLAQRAGRRHLEELIATGGAGDLALLVAEAIRVETSTQPAVAATPIDSPLTPRELDVLRLVAEGLSDREIGETLEISRHTAVRHVANIFLKLEVNSRTQAAIYAFEHGLVPEQRTR